MKSYKILIVEDEPIVAAHIKNILERLGCQVSGISSTGEEAVIAAGIFDTELVLMDIVLAGKMDGIQAAQIIKEKFGIPIIYLTAFSDEDTINKAKVTEPLGFIVKPFEEKDLRSTIEMAAYKHESEKRIKEIEKRYQALFDNSLTCFYLHDGSRHSCTTLKKTNSQLTFRFDNPISAVMSALALAEQPPKRVVC